MINLISETSTPDTLKDSFHAFSLAPTLITSPAPDANILFWLRQLTHFPNQTIEPQSRVGQGQVLLQEGAEGVSGAQE